MALPSRYEDQMKPEPLSKAFQFNQYERVVFLSPHLDDAVLSCGGLLASMKPDVSRLVITVTCGNPVADYIKMDSSGLLSVERKKAAERKGYAPSKIRRREDLLAMEAVDSDYVHLGFPDAIYRRSSVTGKLIYRDTIMGLENPSHEDEGYIKDLLVILRRLTHNMGRVLILSPMAIGGHVDHLICMETALKLWNSKVTVLFYEDWPYVVRGEKDTEILTPPKTVLEKLGYRASKVYYHPFDLRLKTNLILKYESQIPRLFKSEDEVSDLLSRRKFNNGPCEFYWKFVGDYSSSSSSSSS